MRTLVVVKNGIAPCAAGMDANTPHTDYSRTPSASSRQDGRGNEGSMGGKEASKATNLMLVSPDYMDLGEDSRESTGFSETTETHPTVKSLVSADYGEDSSGSSASAYEAQCSLECNNPASLNQAFTESMPAKSDHLESGDGRSNQNEEQPPVSSVFSSGGDVQGVNVPVQSRIVRELLKGTAASSIVSSCVPGGTAEPGRGDIHAHVTEPCKPGGQSRGNEPEDQPLGTTTATTGAMQEAVLNSGVEHCIEPNGTDPIADIPLPSGPPPAAPAGAGAVAAASVEEKPHEAGHAPSTNTAPKLPPEAEGLPPRVVSILLQGQEHYHSSLTPSRPDVPEVLLGKTYDPAVPTPVDDNPLESQGEEVAQETTKKNNEEPMDWNEATGQMEGEAVPDIKGDRGPQEGIDQGEESNFELHIDSDSQPSKMETAEAKPAAPAFQPEEVAGKAVEDVPSHMSRPVHAYPSERDNSNIPPSEGKTPDESSDAPSQEQPAAVPQGGDEPMEENNISQKDSISWCRSDVAQHSGGAKFKRLEESQESSNSQGFHPDYKAAETDFPQIPVPSADSQPEGVVADAGAAAPTHDFGADIRAAIHPPPEQEGEGAANNAISSQFLEDDSMAAGSLLQDEESMLAGDSSPCADEESRVTVDSSSLYPGEDSVVGEESMSLGGEQGEPQRKRKLTYDSVLGVDEESQAAEDVNFPGLTAEGEGEGQAEDAAPSAKRPRRDSASNSVQLAEPASTPAVEVVEGVPVFLPENLFEYQWPQDGGEWHMLQEQISEYLGILSFKRKYPDLSRRTVEKQEKEFLREKGVVSETQCDLGLTALRSEEVYDLMHKDYPDKYQEYANVLHERQKQTIKEQHKEYEVPKLEKSKMAAYLKKAAKSAAEFNLQLQRERKEERRAFFDLQTFTIQYPKGRYKVLPAEKTNTGAYPVALLPGQYQNYAAYYTSDELRYLPLNTVMFDPPKRNKLANPAQAVPAESSEEADSAEDKNGSASASDSDGSGSSDSEDSGPETENGNTEQQAEEVKPEDIKCRVCTTTEKKGKDGKIEMLVKCSECKTHGHPTCLDLPKKMVEIITTYPWQCMECKTCIECMDPYDEDKMMFCDRCDRGYHTFCVGLRSIPTGRWECKSCKGSSSSASSRSRSSSRRSRH